MTFYSLQILMATGFIAELILNGFTPWAQFFIAILLIYSIANAVIEIINGWFT